MNHELEKLLGGFAADTLTPEEKQRLYAAALQDQQLFNALADEQALKELLANPAVRHRLLQALNKTRAAGGSWSWLEWFSRPAGLAWAGGLAAAALAVVLGTRIYQDSLKQAARLVATEDAKPAPPSTSATPPPQSESALMKEAELKAKKHLAPPVEPAKIEAMTDKTARRERAAPSPPSQKQAVPRASRDSPTQRTEQDETRRQADAPVALGKSQEQLTGALEQKATADQAPQAVASTPAEMPARINAPAAAVGGPATGARALYYGESARPDAGMMTQKKERAMIPLHEGLQQFGRLEQKKDRVAAAGNAGELAAVAKPLGLRYSLASGQLTVEANQESYVQVWTTAESSNVQLLFPQKESGQISSRLVAGRRQSILLPSERGTITIRLSRVPFGPITRQEAMLLDRPVANQLQESVGQEQATYVVNRDSAPTAQLTIDIPLGR